MALRLRTTLLLSLVAIALITLVSLTYRPLRFVDGTVLEMVPILVFGHWAAIVIGIAFQAFYAQRVAAEANSMADALLAAQMALSREQKLTDLGGVVAATAHETGHALGHDQAGQRRACRRTGRPARPCRRCPLAGATGRPLPHDPAVHGAQRQGRHPYAPRASGSRSARSRRTASGPRQARAFPAGPGKRLRNAATADPAPPRTNPWFAQPDPERGGFRRVRGLGHRMLDRAKPAHPYLR